MKKRTRPMVHTERSVLTRAVEVGDCMEWTGYLANGVPAVSHNGKMVMVRRLLLQLRGIPIPPGAFVACKCGSQLCVNPAHIQVRTKSQHATAMANNVDHKSPVRRKKLADAARESRAKLTIEKAREIRASTEPASIVALQHGVSKSLICGIRRNRSWREAGSVWAGL